MNRLLSVSVAQGDCFDGRTLDVVLFARWWFWFHISLDVHLSGIRTLANGDIVDRSEVVAPDDWRNQPTRPNGLPW